MALTCCNDLSECQTGINKQSGAVSSSVILSVWSVLGGGRLKCFNANFTTRPLKIVFSVSSKYEMSVQGDSVMSNGAAVMGGNPERYVK